MDSELIVWMECGVIYKFVYYDYAAARQATETQ